MDNHNELKFLTEIEVIKTRVNYIEALNKTTLTVVVIQFVGFLIALINIFLKL